MVARIPAASEISASTIGMKRRISGSMTTRPGSPSWSSSSQMTSGGAVRAANVRLA